MANKVQLGLNARFTINSKQYLAAMSRIETTTAKASKRLSAVSRGLRFDPSNLVLLSQKQKQFNILLTAAKQKLDANNRALANTKKNSAAYNDLTNKLIRNKAEVDRLTQAFKRATTEANKFTQVGKKLVKFGDTISNNVRRPMLAVGLAVGAATRVSKTYREAVANVATITKRAYVENKKFNSSIFDISSETGVGATEVVNALYHAVSAGIIDLKDATYSLDLLRNGMKLAKVGMAETEETVKLLSGILNAYSLSAKDSAYVSDVLVRTQNKGVTTLEEMRDTLGRVVPWAAAAGVSIEDLAGSVSFFTRQGIKTDQTVVAMINIFKYLAKTQSKSAKILKEQTGKTFKELTAEGWDLYDVLQAIQKGTAEKGLNIADVFGIRGAIGVLTVLNKGRDEYKALIGEIKENKSALAIAFGEQKEFRKVDIALNKLKVAFLRLGGEVLKALVPTLNKLAEWANKLAENEDLVKAIGKGMVNLLKVLVVAFSTGKIVKFIGHALVLQGILLSFNKLAIAGVLGKANTAMKALTSSAIGLQSVISKAFLPIFAAVKAIDYISGKLETKNKANAKAERAFAESLSYSELVSYQNQKAAFIDRLDMNGERFNRYSKKTATDEWNKRVVQNITITADAEITDDKIQEISTKLEEVVGLQMARG